MKYDVALSFAGENRKYVEAVATELKNLGIRVFYDDFETASLWGKDLYTYLQKIYQEDSEYVVFFISKHYAEKLWTNHERKMAQARAFTEKREYILPARFDDTEIEGITQTIGYIDLNKLTSKEFAKVIFEKINSEKTTINVNNTFHKLNENSQNQLFKYLGILIVILLLTSVTIGLIAMLYNSSNSNQNIKQTGYPDSINLNGNKISAINQTANSSNVNSMNLSSVNVNNSNVVTMPDKEQLQKLADEYISNQIKKGSEIESKKNRKTFYGDLDGDGDEDAVIQYITSPDTSGGVSGSMASYFGVSLLVCRNEDGKFEVITEETVGGTFNRTFETTGIKKGKITGITERCINSDDEDSGGGNVTNCISNGSTIKGSTQYSLKGGKLVEM